MNKIWITNKAHVSEVVQAKYHVVGQLKTESY